MNTGVISVRYARALLRCSVDAGVEQMVYASMMSLAKSYIDVPALRDAIDNPMIDREVKLSLLSAAAGITQAGVSDNAASPVSVSPNILNDLLYKFFSLVLKQGRGDMMQFVSNAFVSLYREQKHIIRARLTTAAALSTDMEVKLRRLVESGTNGNVDFETSVEPALIGGFVLEYDTYRMDASVKSELGIILSRLKK